MGCLAFDSFFGDANIQLMFIEVGLSFEFELYLRSIEVFLRKLSHNELYFGH